MSIKIEDWEVVGWRHAIKGMRNALESWDKSESMFYDHVDFEKQEIHYHDILKQPYGTAYFDDIPEDIVKKLSKASYHERGFSLGENDLKLMMTLNKGGTSESKYRRFIICYVDITAPLYMLKELDTYRHGVEKLSCSTMHRIHTRDLTLDDFSHEHLFNKYGDPSMNINYGFKHPTDVLVDLIHVINHFREEYIFNDKDKKYWWQLIQLLPSSYNQKRTYMFSYEALAKIYKERKNHKLDEWHELCAWIETLPYSELITGKENA